MSAPSKNVIEVSGARVRQGTEDLLPATTLSFPPGDVVIALGTPGPTLTALALAVAGRLPLSEGSISYDGRVDAELLRQRVALVDVPSVTEPEHGVPVRTIVAEELAFAGLPNGRRAANQWLADHGRSDWGSLRGEQVPALERVNALADLAALRPGITHLVIGFPERHGGPPSEWLAVAQRHADAGLGVLLTVSHATATDHDATFVVGAAPSATPDEAPEGGPAPGLATAAPPERDPEQTVEGLEAQDPVAHELETEESETQEPAAREQAAEQPDARERQAHEADPEPEAPERDPQESTPQDQEVQGENA